MNESNKYFRESLYRFVNNCSSNSLNILFSIFKFSLIFSRHTVNKTSKYRDINRNTRSRFIKYKTFEYLLRFTEFINNIRTHLRFHARVKQATRNKIHGKQRIGTNNRRRGRRNNSSNTGGKRDLYSHCKTGRKPCGNFSRNQP